MCFSDIFKTRHTGKCIPNNMCFTTVNPKLRQYFSNRSPYILNKFYATTKQGTFGIQLINIGNILHEIKFSPSRHSGEKNWFVTIFR